MPAGHSSQERVTAAEKGPVENWLVRERAAGQPRIASCPSAKNTPMFLRIRRSDDGLRVLGRLVSPRYQYGPTPAQAVHSARPYSKSASVRPRLLPCAYTPAVVSSQLRVLRTQSDTKGVQYLPQSYTSTSTTSCAGRPLNWSSTIHRMRHLYPSTMTTTTQTRSHAGHSHHHHHHHDNSLLLSKNKNDAGVRITKIGLYVNLGMAISKGVGGYIFNSQGETVPSPSSIHTHS